MYHIEYKSEVTQEWTTIRNGYGEPIRKSTVEAAKNYIDFLNRDCPGEELRYVEE